MSTFGSDADNTTDSPIVPADAGIKAAERVRARKETVVKAARRFHMLVTLLLILAACGIAAYGDYLWRNKTTGYNVDERPCHAEIGKQEVSGKRTYSYPYFEIMGFRFLDTSKVTERTQIDVRGTPFTVVGLKGEAQWKGYPVSSGERGILILDQADTYVFFYDEKSVGAVSYNTLCK